jgi:hypothetical protein
MNTRNYLAMARSRANERFYGADGFIDDDLNFAGDDSFFGADGDAMSPMAPTSQPYIITITHTGASNFTSGIDIMGAFTYLNGISGNIGNYSWSSGSLQLANGAGGYITISSALSNVNYQQFLFQTMTNPFSVGMMYIQAGSNGGSTGYLSQIVVPITLTTQDANGNQAQKTLTPTVDPYQNQTNVLALRQPYRADGFTKLTIPTIYATTTTTIRIYPSDTINLARGLAGRSVSQEYGNPGIVKAQPLKLV